jgi:hypothetical protein
MTHRIKDDLLYCPKCDSYKTKDNFYRHSSRPDGYGAYCKTCESTYPPRSTTGLGQKKEPKGPRITPAVPNEHGLFKCNLCKLDKPKSDFSTAKTTRGISYYCKSCSKEYVRRYRKPKGTKGKRTRPTDTNGNLQCSLCKLFKHPDEFHFSKDVKTQRASRCKTCIYPQVCNKKCLQCGVVKPTSAFDSTKKEHKRRCIACDTEEAKSKAITKEEKRKNRTPKKYYVCKKRASERDIIFLVTPSEFTSIVSKPCFYCGTCEQIGIDRIDSSQGYVIGNCAPCCFYCNVAKNDLTLEAFKARISKIYQHLSLQNL